MKGNASIRLPTVARRWKGWITQAGLGGIIGITGIRPIPAGRVHVVEQDVIRISRYSTAIILNECVARRHVANLECAGGLSHRVSNRALFPESEDVAFAGYHGYRSI